MSPTPDVTSIIARGRTVLKAHPSIGLDAAGLLHALDLLEPTDRDHARAYLLHVYGLTVGITTPANVIIEEWPHLELHSPKVTTANDEEPGPGAWLYLTGTHLPACNARCVASSHWLHPDDSVVGRG